MNDHIDGLVDVIRDGFCTGQVHSFHEHGEALRELVAIAREAEAENMQLREALSNTLIAMDAWGAEEDGIPSDFGAWDAYCDGARLLGWHIYPEQAVEGADDE